MHKKPELNLRAKALDFLSRRDYSYLELFNKLSKYTDDEIAIRSVLDEMVSKNFLNEERYIEAFINSKSRKFGSKKIRYLLCSKVGNSDLVNDIYSKTEINELQIACEQLIKKYPSPPQDNKERAKYLRFLLNRGFSYEIINQALAQAYEVEL